MDYLSFLPARDGIQSSIKSVQRLTRPTETSYNRHVAARKEVVGLSALRMLEAAKQCKIASQNFVATVTQIIKRKQPTISLVNVSTQILRVVKFAAAILASLVAGIVRPEWSLKVYHKLSPLNEQENRLPISFQQLVAGLGACIAAAGLYYGLRSKLAAPAPAAMVEVKGSAVGLLQKILCVYAALSVVTLSVALAIHSKTKAKEKLLQQEKLEREAVIQVIQVITAKLRELGEGNTIKVITRAGKSYEGILSGLYGCTAHIRKGERTESVDITTIDPALAKLVHPTKKVRDTFRALQENDKIGFQDSEGRLHCGWYIPGDLNRVAYQSAATGYRYCDVTGITSQGVTLLDRPLPGDNGNPVTAGLEHTIAQLHTFDEGDRISLDNHGEGVFRGFFDPGHLALQSDTGEVHWIAVGALKDTEITLTQRADVSPERRDEAACMKFMLTKCNVGEGVRVFSKFGISYQGPIRGFEDNAVMIGEQSLKYSWISPIGFYVNVEGREGWRDYHEVFPNSEVQAKLATFGVGTWISYSYGLEDYAGKIISITDSQVTLETLSQNLVIKFEHLIPLYMSRLADDEAQVATKLLAFKGKRVELKHSDPKKGFVLRGPLVALNGKGVKLGSEGLVMPYQKIDDISELPDFPEGWQPEIP